MISYDINGVSLGDSAGRWWVTAEGSSHSPAASVRSVDSKTPWMPGLVQSPIAEVLEEATMNLRVMVASRDESVREARWDAVKALVSGGMPFTLGRTVDGVRRSTIAKLRSISEPELRSNAGTLAGVISLTILDGVFHSSPADVTVPLTTAGATVTLPAVAGSAATFDWWARVNGACGSVLLESVDGVVDSTRAAGWTGTKSSAQRLFLRRFTAWTAAGDAWTEPAAPNQLGAVTSGAFGSLVLMPRPTGADPMVRAAKVRVSGTGVDGTTITIRAGSSWV